MQNKRSLRYAGLATALVVVLSFIAACGGGYGGGGGGGPYPTVAPSGHM